MRIVTRPDFDGIVCAVLIYETEDINEPVLWIEPSQVQHGEIKIKKGDIMANLPYDKRCSMWFDHHVSNETEKKIPGAFKIAPSAAGVAYDYYKGLGRLEKNFDELIKETDIIDAADLSRDMVLRPEEYPYILLSMTINNRDESDPPYWNRLAALLREKNISEILDDSEVKKRCKMVVEENKAFEKILKTHTKIHGSISVADFRNMEKAPSGNRFLTYSLFPESMASVKIRYDHKDKNIVLLSIGRSIFNDRFRVNIGKLLSRYGGGGHAGAGGCSMDSSAADENLKEILEIMHKNQSI
ncbi:MAG: exopolyphosphatase [Thermodesulfobacteriota bacterium]|nr:exopolyphosphatase [Thermodesulfobacteriota bacterium]